MGRHYGRRHSSSVNELWFFVHGPEVARLTQFVYISSIDKVIAKGRQ